MKILVFGAGVIGTVYAWQMSEAGHDVTLLVRKQRMVRYSHSGVTINCTDMREKKTEYVKTVFRPRIIDRLEPKNTFDLIIVSVRSQQLNDAVPYISQFSGKAHILFLGNLWNEFKLIEKHLPRGRYFFGYPSMAGGGRSENSINCYLFSNYNTLIGEVDGSVSARLKQLFSILETSGLQPKISSRITTWIQSYYVVPAVLFGAIQKAGGARRMVENNRLIFQAAMAIKEGHNVCIKKGVKPRKIFPYTLFFLPAKIIAYLMKRSYSPERLAMIEAQMKHGCDELRKQYYDLLNEGKKLGVQMPYLTSFEKHIKPE
jgi:ketopantoate reductase